MAQYLTDQIVLTEAQALYAEGRRYTVRQLYYAVCAVMEAPRVAVAPAILGLGVLLMVGAVIAIHIVILAYALGLLGILLLAYGARMRVVETHRLKSVRARVVGYHEFVRGFVEPHAALPEHFPGLLDVAAFAAPEAVRNGVALLVCDSAENAAIVAEALRDDRIEADVVDLERLGDLGVGQRIFAIHDASPRGCALPAELGDRGRHDVIDVAITPAAAVGEDFQVIEGAPAFLPRDLSQLLPAADCDWLRGGHRLELAAYPVARLQLLLRHVLESGEPAAATDQEVADGGAVAASDPGVG